jgi:hypothetical protein
MTHGQLFMGHWHVGREEVHVALQKEDVARAEEALRHLRQLFAQLRPDTIFNAP